MGVDLRKKVGGTDRDQGEILREGAGSPLPPGRR